MPIVWYGGFLPGLPDLCVGRWPAGVAAKTPWKVWIVETPQERAALLASVAKPVAIRGGGLDFKSGPDAMVSGPIRGDSVIALYLPPEPGWPWFTVGRWPPEVALGIGAQREAYTWEADATEAAALDRIARMRSQMPHMPVVVPDRKQAN
ncbi:hypothetical protein VQ02_33595 [Methylobacterium variabile]|uniref:Uncharacterized protein n=2 Tax=Methylobacterium variabile TaxID=298794 RepID=A0A0J6S0R5_9HYPH|nr:hypothetical protein VQ02_33595 [Methylobacterium variabile]